MVVAFRELQGDGTVVPHYFSSSPDFHVTIGMLEAAKLQVWDGRKG